MSRLIHDAAGEKYFRTGISKAILFPVNSDGYAAGVAWNGVVSLDESSEGGNETLLWADNVPYGSISSVDRYKATLEAYMHPDEFYPCTGYVKNEKGLIIGNQRKTRFGIVYREEIANDKVQVGNMYSLHLIYGLVCGQATMTHKTINDSPDVQTMKWDIRSLPINIEGTNYAPTSSIELNSTKISPFSMAVLDAILYGSDEYSKKKEYHFGDIVEHEEIQNDKKVKKLYMCRSETKAPGFWNPINDWLKINDLAGPRLPMPKEVIDILTIGAMYVYYKTSDGHVYCTSDGKFYQLS